MGPDLTSVTQTGDTLLTLDPGKENATAEPLTEGGQARPRPGGLPPAAGAGLASGGVLPKTGSMCYESL